jgi:hypothetical protein
MVGNAHGGGVAFNVEPFVVGGVFDGHEKLLKREIEMNEKPKI